MDKRTKAYKNQKAKELVVKTQVTVNDQGEEVGLVGGAMGVSPLQDPLPAGISSKVPNGVISSRPTKPWEKKLIGNKPWRRDITALSKEDRAFHCRWVNNEFIDARIERGYDIADPKKWGAPTDKIVDDASPLGRRIVRRNMTLMEIPQEGKKFFEDNIEKTIIARKRDARAMVKKQAEELLAKAGFAVQVVDKSKVERNGVSVSD